MSRSCRDACSRGAIREAYPLSNGERRELVPYPVVEITGDPQAFGGAGRLGELLLGGGELLASLGLSQGNSGNKHGE